MAQTQGFLKHTWGAFGNTWSNTTNTFALNAAANWLAFGFVGNGKTLSTVDAYISALTGSLTGAQLQMEIYSNSSSGAPNASISGPHNCGSSISAGAWHQWSPSYATTAGTMYWLVFKNVHGTPASNYPTFQFSAGYASHLSGTVRYGWAKTHSTTSGASWITNVTGGNNCLLGFSDSTYDGFPMQTIGVNNSAYGKVETGVKFTSPPISIPCNGIWFVCASNTGTPTNPVFGRLWTGASAYTDSVDTVAAGVINAGSWNFLRFTSTVWLPVSSTIRCVLATTGSDTSSNCYRLYTATVKNDANSKLLVPFNGTGILTSTTDGTVGTPTWSDTDTQVPSICPGIDFPELLAGGGPAHLINGGLVR